MSAQIEIPQIIVEGKIIYFKKPIILTVEWEDGEWMIANDGGIKCVLMVANDFFEALKGTYEQLELDWLSSIWTDEPDGAFSQDSLDHRKQWLSEVVKIIDIKTGEEIRP